MTDGEAAAFRTYLQKGGFVIFDDFADYAALGQFRAADAARAAGGAHLSTWTSASPIFHAFFEIKTLDRPAVLRSAAEADLPGDLRGQRSEEADAW